MQKARSYFVYLLTNPKKTVLYIGMTNDLQRRLSEHEMARESGTKSFTARYFCYNLIYYEVYDNPTAAIAREKQLKNWSRSKKEALIATQNPDWNFLNQEIREWDC